MYLYFLSICLFLFLCACGRVLCVSVEAWGRNARPVRPTGVEAMDQSIKFRGIDHEFGEVYPVSAPTPEAVQNFPDVVLEAIGVRFCEVVMYIYDVCNAVCNAALLYVVYQATASPEAGVLRPDGGQPPPGGPAEDDLKEGEASPICRPNKGYYP
jgi:hypothetical protein